MIKKKNLRIKSASPDTIRKKYFNVFNKNKALFKIKKTEKYNFLQKNNLQNNHIKLIFHQYQINLIFKLDLFEMKFKKTLDNINYYINKKKIDFTEMKYKYGNKCANFFLGNEFNLIKNDHNYIIKNLIKKYPSKINKIINYEILIFEHSIKLGMNYIKEIQTNEFNSFKKLIDYKNIFKFIIYIINFEEYSINNINIIKEKLNYLDFKFNDNFKKEIKNMYDINNLINIKINDIKWDEKIINYKKKMKNCNFNLCLTILKFNIKNRFDIIMVNFLLKYYLFLYYISNIKEKKGTQILFSCFKNYEKFINYFIDLKIKYEFLIKYYFDYKLKNNDKLFKEYNYKKICLWIIKTKYRFFYMNKYLNYIDSILNIEFLKKILYDISAILLKNNMINEAIYIYEFLLNIFNSYENISNFSLDGKGKSKKCYKSEKNIKNNLEVFSINLKVIDLYWANKDYTIATIYMVSNYFIYSNSMKLMTEIDENRFPKKNNLILNKDNWMYEKDIGIKLRFKKYYDSLKNFYDININKIKKLFEIISFFDQSKIDKDLIKLIKSDLIYKLSKLKIYNKKNFYAIINLFYKDFKLNQIKNNYQKDYIGIFNNIDLENYILKTIFKSKSNNNDINKVRIGFQEKQYYFSIKREKSIITQVINFNFYENIKSLLITENYHSKYLVNLKFKEYFNTLTHYINDFDSYLLNLHFNNIKKKLSAIIKEKKIKELNKIKEIDRFSYLRGRIKNPDSDIGLILRNNKLFNKNINFSNIYLSQFNNKTIIKGNYNIINNSKYNNIIKNKRNSQIITHSNNLYENYDFIQKFEFYKFLKPSYELKHKKKKTNSWKEGDIYLYKKTNEIYFYHIDFSKDLINKLNFTGNYFFNNRNYFFNYKLVLNDKNIKILIKQNSNRIRDEYNFFINFNLNEKLLILKDKYIYNKKFNFQTYFPIIYNYIWLNYLNEIFDISLVKKLKESFNLKNNYLKFLLDKIGLFLSFQYMELLINKKIFLNISKNFEFITKIDINAFNCWYKLIQIILLISNSVKIYKITGNIINNLENFMVLKKFRFLYKFLIYKIKIKKYYYNLKKKYLNVFLLKKVLKFNNHFISKNEILLIIKLMKFLLIKIKWISSDKNKVKSYLYSKIKKSNKNDFLFFNCYIKFKNFENDFKNFKIILKNTMSKNISFEKKRIIMIFYIIQFLNNYIIFEVNIDSFFKNFIKNLNKNKIKNNDLIIFKYLENNNITNNKIKVNFNIFLIILTNISTINWVNNEKLINIFDILTKDLNNVYINLLSFLNNPFKSSNLKYFSNLLWEKILNKYLFTNNYYEIIKVKYNNNHYDEKNYIISYKNLYLFNSSKFNYYLKQLQIFNESKLWEFDKKSYRNIDIKNFNKFSNDLNKIKAVKKEKIKSSTNSFLSRIDTLKDKINQKLAKNKPNYKINPELLKYNDNLKKYYLNKNETEKLKNNFFKNENFKKAQIIYGNKIFNENFKQINNIRLKYNNIYTKDNNNIYQKLNTKYYVNSTINNKPKDLIIKSRKSNYKIEVVMDNNILISLKWSFIKNSKIVKYDIFNPFLTYRCLKILNYSNEKIRQKELNYLFKYKIWYNFPNNFGNIDQLNTKLFNYNNTLTAKISYNKKFNIFKIKTFSLINKNSMIVICNNNYYKVNQKNIDLEYYRKKIENNEDVKKEILLSSVNKNYLYFKKFYKYINIFNLFFNETNFNGENFYFKISIIILNKGNNYNNKTWISYNNYKDFYEIIYNRIWKIKNKIIDKLFYKEENIIFLFEFYKQKNKTNLYKLIINNNDFNNIFKIEDFENYWRNKITIYNSKILFINLLRYIMKNMIIINIDYFAKPVIVIKSEYNYLFLHNNFKINKESISTVSIINYRYQKLCTIIKKIKNYFCIASVYIKFEDIEIRLYFPKSLRNFKIKIKKDMLNDYLNNFEKYLLDLFNFDGKNYTYRNNKEFFIKNCFNYKFKNNNLTHYSIFKFLNNNFFINENLNKYIFYVIFNIIIKDIFSKYDNDNDSFNFKEKNILLKETIFNTYYNQKLNEIKYIEIKIKSNNDNKENIINNNFYNNLYIYYNNLSSYNFYFKQICLDSNLNKNIIKNKINLKELYLLSQNTLFNAIDKISLKIIKDVSKFYINGNKLKK